MGVMIVVSALLWFCVVIPGLFVVGAAILWVIGHLDCINPR
jgi:hypothetical protein